MPFYEYECSSCKFYSEVMQKITDPPLKKCPSCGKNTLKKLVSAPNFRLKGGGWYETDFKSDKESKRNLAQAEKSEPKEASSAGASETKAEPKAAEAKAAESKSASESPAGQSVSMSHKSAGTSRAAPSRAAPSRAMPSRAMPSRAAKAKSARPKSRPARKARR